MKCADCSNDFECTKQRFSFCLERSECYCLRCWVEWILKGYPTLDPQDIEFIFQCYNTNIKDIITLLI